MFALLSLCNDGGPKHFDLKSIYQRRIKGYIAENHTIAKDLYYETTVYASNKEKITVKRIKKALRHLKDSGCARVVIPQGFAFGDLIAEEGLQLVKADRVLKEHLALSIKTIVDSADINVKRNRICIFARPREAVKHLIKISRYAGEMYIWSDEYNEDEAEYIMQETGVSVIFTCDTNLVSSCRFVIMLTQPEGMEFNFRHAIVYNFTNERLSASGAAFVIDDMVFKLPAPLAEVFPKRDFSTSDFLEAARWEAYGEAKILGYKSHGGFIPASDMIYYIKLLT